MKGNFANFQTLYKPIILGCPFIEKDVSREQYRQLLTINNLAAILSKLPGALHSEIRKELQFPAAMGRVDCLSQEELFTLYKSRLHTLFDPEERNCNVIQAKAVVAKGITSAVRHAVFRSSVDQAIRGNLSFGMLNSVQYVVKKIKKFIK